VTKYLIYGGTSRASLSQVAVTPATVTLYTYRPLTPATTYYFGLIAVASGIQSPMANIASAMTLPLPNAPDHVVATAVSASKITLTWSESLPPNGLPILHYQVYRGTTAGKLTQVATVTSATYNSVALAPSTAYFFEVVAVDTSFDSSIPSTPVSVTTLPLPPAPTSVQGTAISTTKVKLTWQWAAAPGGLSNSSFSVYCRTAAAGQSKVGGSRSDTFTYASAAPATQYYCYVVAVDTGFDDSAPSRTVAVSTATPPNAPTAVQATASSATKVTVTWSEKVPTGGLAISSYKIYRSTTLPVTTADLVATRTGASYTDTTVSASTTYYYAISAIDSGQDASPLSAPAPVATP
jgi:fibronectin type 3 domain-containing protein